MDAEQDVSDYVEEHLFEPKIETVLEETIIEEHLEEEVAPDQIDLPLENVIIGPEGATFHNEFVVGKRFYRGQYTAPEKTNWTIKSNSVREFREYLFKLVQPYIKRAVVFESVNEPCWSDKEVPTKEDLGLYVSIKDRTQKRIWKLESVDEHKLCTWSNKTLDMQVFIYSNQVPSRAAFDLVRDILLDPSSSNKVVRENNEGLKLLVMMKRLQKIHRTYLSAKDEHFKKWAQSILEAPQQKQEALCYKNPPKDMRDHFTVLRKGQHPRNPKKRKSKKMGPAQRDQASDGFGFMDEVKAMRRTVSQIKDLVEMLNKRIVLLEDKCHGYEQRDHQGRPAKKAKREDNSDSDEDEDDDNDDDEPVIDEPISDQEAVNKEHSGNPDPLLFNDMIELVKQEDEYDDDEED